MPTLRIFMENYIHKSYSEKKVTYHGDLARIRNFYTIKTQNPFYTIHINNSKNVCLIGIEPNIILFMCPNGIERIKNFERTIQTSLLWCQDINGNIYGTNLINNYLLSYVLTGLNNVKHSDGNPLNYRMDNLVNIGEKKNETKNNHP